MIELQKCGHAVGAVTQRAKAGDVIGVKMRIDSLDEAQVEFVEQLDVTVDLLQHGVDDQRLGAPAARDQVAVGA